MTPLTPKSTLFPYTTLFRSPILEKSHWPVILLPFKSATPIETVKAAVEAHMVLRVDTTGLDHGGEKHGFSNSAPVRSEEHTSELQSRQYLVCRLLLEKKK